MKAPLLSVLVLAPLLGSCLSQSPPPRVRWFLLESTRFEPAPAEGENPLRLEPVRSRAHLRRPMVWRLSDVEVFFDELELWGAEPAELVRGVLEEALFDAGPFTASEDHAAPGASVELRAFEGVYGERDEARCELTVVHDDGKLVRQAVFASSEPLASRRPDELARGLGVALERVAEELRAWLRTSG